MYNLWFELCVRLFLKLAQWLCEFLLPSWVKNPGFIYYYVDGNLDYIMFASNYIYIFII